MSYSSFPNTSHKYAYFWEKYRPALLKLMMASAEGPQQYRFSSHEVKTANAKDKAYAFLLKFHQGRATNNVRESIIAKDLAWILQQSGKATALSDLSAYVFRLDKQFVLHVARELQETVKVEPDVAAVVES